MTSTLVRLLLRHVRIQSPPPPPQENQKVKGFLTNSGPDPMENHKATKSSIQYWSIIGVSLARFQRYVDPLSSHQLKIKRLSKLDASDKTVWILSCKWNWPPKYTYPEERTDDNCRELRLCISMNFKA